MPIDNRDVSLDRPAEEVATAVGKPISPKNEPIAVPALNEAPELAAAEGIEEEVKDEKGAASAISPQQPTLASQNLLAAQSDATVIERLPLTSTIFKGEHLYSMLGYRVRITHPPKRDKASETLVGKSGIIVAVLKRQKMLRLHLDDGREVDIKRHFLRVDNSKDVPVDIYMRASGLANLDL
jgi:hypothetical protein